MSSGASNRSKTTMATETDYAILSTVTSSLLGCTGPTVQVLPTPTNDTTPGSPPATTTETNSRDTTRCDSGNGGTNRDSCNSGKISINIDVEKQRKTRRKNQDKSQPIA